jgi:predicted SprT family Zn-dependent metalloprotease
MYSMRYFASRATPENLSRLIAHELVHVRQYERVGGIEPFLKEYVKEVVFPPEYPNGPLEQEAILLTAYITRTDR